MNNYFLNKYYTCLAFALPSHYLNSRRLIYYDLKNVKLYLYCLKDKSYYYRKIHNSLSKAICIPKLYTY